MSYLPLIISLVSGAGGANALGNAVKSMNLGPVGNTLAGRAAGGGALTAITAYLKLMFAKPT